MTITHRSIDYTGLPEHMRDGARRYIEHGIKPGAFLTAVICNDFTAAFRHADGINRARLPDFARFFESEVPYACWGARWHFHSWIAHSGQEWRDP